MKRMLDDEFESCYGCTACKNICPKKAIVMCKNAEGFLYPKIDQDLCISCNLCKKVCPINNSSLNENIIKEYYAAKLKNEKERMKSRSGGIFVTLSDVILKNNGVIYGATLDRNLDVLHIRCDNFEKRDLCRGSKYVQSDPNETFLQVYKDLRQGRHVLYTGTSCQIHGLNLFLQHKKAVTDNLYTCDIICHGVPSPLIYREYLAFLEKKYNNKIINFNFRDKKFGWGSHFETVLFENGKGLTFEYFKNLFYSNYILRKSCYNCNYSNLNRIADITIGDCWGIENIDSNWNDHKGVSLVIINTLNGKNLFEKSMTDIDYISVDIDKCMQPNLSHPTERPNDRESLWNVYKNSGFKYVLKKYGKYTIVNRYKNNFRNIKFKLRQVIKK